MWESIDVQNIRTRGTIVDMKSDMQKRHESVTQVDDINSPDILEDLEGQENLEEFGERSEKRSNVDELTESTMPLDTNSCEKNDAIMNGDDVTEANYGIDSNVTLDEDEIELEACQSSDMDVSVEETTVHVPQPSSLNVNDIHEQSSSSIEPTEQKELATAEEGDSGEKVRKISSHKMPTRGKAVQAKVSGERRTVNDPQRPRGVKAVSGISASAKKDPKSTGKTRGALNSPKSMRHGVLSKSFSSGNVNSRDRSGSSASSASTVSQKSMSSSASQRSESKVASKTTLNNPKKGSSKGLKSTKSVKPNNSSKPTPNGTNSSKTIGLRRSLSNVSSNSKGPSQNGESNFKRNTPSRNTIATTGKTRETLSHRAPATKSSSKPSNASQRQVFNGSMKKSQTRPQQGKLYSKSSQSSDTNSLESEASIDKSVKNKKTSSYVRTRKTPTSNTSRNFEPSPKGSATSVKSVSKQMANISSVSKQRETKLRNITGKKKTPRLPGKTLPSNNPIKDSKQGTNGLSKPGEPILKSNEDNSDEKTLKVSMHSATHEVHSTPNETTPVKRATKSGPVHTASETPKKMPLGGTIDKHDTRQEESVFNRSRIGNLSLPSESRSASRRKGSTPSIPTTSNPIFSRSRNASLPAEYRKTDGVTLRKKGEKKGALSKIYKRFSWRGSSDHGLKSSPIREETVTESQRTVVKKTKKVTKTHKDPKSGKTVPSKSSSLEETKPQKTTSSRLKLFGKSK